MPDNDDLRKRQQRIYERAATDYDAVRFGAPAGRWLQLINETEMAAALERHTPASPHGLRCLDLGCGTGRLAVPLARRGHRMVGLDATRAMVAQLGQREASARVSCIQGDAFRLPFGADSFDAVYSLRLFHLFKPEIYPRLISEIHRVLRPGGISIVEVNNPDFALGLGWWRDRIRRRWLERREVSSTIRIKGISEFWRKWDLLEIRGIWWPGLHRKANRVEEADLVRFHAKVSTHSIYKRLMFFYWVVARKR